MYVYIYIYICIMCVFLACAETVNKFGAASLNQGPSRSARSLRDSRLKSKIAQKPFSKGPLVPRRISTQKLY